METHTTEQQKQAVKDAIKAAGGAIKVAEERDLTPHAVRKWAKVGKVPPKHIPTLCEMGNNQVLPSSLDPEVYPLPN